MFLKISFLINLLLLFFPFSCSKILDNQRFLIDSTDENKLEDGQNYINLVNIDVNKYHGNYNYLYVLIEINVKENDSNLFFIQSINKRCSLLRSTAYNVANVDFDVVNPYVKKILFEESFREEYRRGINICLSEHFTEGSPLLTIRPLFYKDIDWDGNPSIPFELSDPSDRHFHKHLNLPGIKALITKKNITSHNQCELSKIICYLNLENLKKRKVRRGHFLMSDQGSSSSQTRNLSYLRFCITFNSVGNYFILIKGIYSKTLIFYQKVENKNETKCLQKDLDKNDEELIKSLRGKIEINAIKTYEEGINSGLFSITELIFEQDNENNEKFIFIDHILYKLEETVNVATVFPLIEDGFYEFYIDREGITREIRVENDKREREKKNYLKSEFLNSLCTIEFN
ncbi:hypothetical protein Mgra_00007299 [Meloidogyne graminicola]|uniref:Uncharacterized protein n=1 Tax=Meloidogyne graminicola TaxID=189291 RepID=A0A8S9ZJ71_9BILA|nr:hypothetical protein Mgra_00007299 [Meloidogyne graminicola]